MIGFTELHEEVLKGMKGLNDSLPFGFPRLSKYVGIRKRIMSLIVGSSGSGKSAFVQSAFILHPFDYLLKNPTSSIKFKVILFSMERNSVYILAKWVSRRIFLEQGIFIPIPRLLGWWGDKEKLTADEHDLFLSTKEYINSLLEVVDIVDGPINPTGAYKYVKTYAEKNGEFEKIDEYREIYHPYCENEIVEIIFDHMGLTKVEKDYPTKKEAIDKLSSYSQLFRDKYGYTPIFVSQLNRNLSNPLFQKMDNFEPTIDEIKESGNPGEASDIIISIFDPLRFRTNDISYDVNKFVDPSNGNNCFRSIKVLKNTYGIDSVRVGLAFEGATGTFRELPKKADMEGFSYENLFSGEYFLNT